MDLVIALSLILPVVHCPITSVSTVSGRADLNSITEHITLLEQQVTTLQYEFDTELKSTLVELANVQNELRASQEEQIDLKNGLQDKCRLLKLTSMELNSTKLEIFRLKDSVNDVKVTCSTSSQSVSNVTDIEGAINSSTSFHVALSHALRSVEDKSVIKFDKVQSNKGKYYDAESGIFKAPIQGSYMVWANIYLTEPNSFINIFAHRGDTIIAHAHTETSEGEPKGLATTVAVTYLNPGDRVWFTKDSGSSVIYGTNTDDTSSFGCILLRAF